MANKKITELTDLPSPSGADIMAIVNDVSGTPTTKKVTVSNLMTLAPVQTSDLNGLQAEPAEGAFIDGDKTKLDGIETNADVTNTANVTSAGALMDSEVTNLAEVKAFDSSDYATAAQGATADSALQSVSAGDLTDGDFDGETILGFNASINLETGTAYTILASDNGTVLVFNNGSPVTVTVPSGLGVGFNCSIIQRGAGQVSFSASGTTINNSQLHTKISGRHGVATLISYDTNLFVLAGDTAS